VDTVRHRTRVLAGLASRREGLGSGFGNLFLSYDESTVWSADLFRGQRIQTCLPGRGVYFRMSGRRSREKCSPATGHQAGTSFHHILKDQLSDM
jgi:hypothetical protein